MFLRLHTPPVKVKRIRVECRNAKLRWLYARSRERYDRWPEGMHTNEEVRSTLRKGEIGRFEGVRLAIT